MPQDYWSRILAPRLNRRRAVSGGIGITTAAVFLAACGGGGDKGKPENVSGVVTVPKDTTKSAKRGGTLPLRRSADVTHFDPFVPLGNAGVPTSMVFSRLIRLKPGLNQPPGTEYLGDLVDSWELSPDKLQITFKLRANASWHNVAPVNGRKVDADDIVASWKRFESRAVNAANFSGVKNPSAPIESMRAVDMRTVAAKLTQPVSSLLGLLATSAAGMFFLPRDADGGYDARQTAIGSGPWMVEEYFASSRVAYKRHDGHHEVDRVFIDKATEFVLPEYAAMLAQLKAGKIFAGPQDVRQEDIVPLKNEVPALNVYVQDPVPPYGCFKFGWNPALGAKTPFRDKRLRQAFALSIDRDTYIDAIYNVDKLQKDGFPIKGYLDTAVQPDTGGPYWLDPRSKDFGPNAKYFQYDVAEAKKLVAAAGFASGFDVNGVYGNFGRDVWTRTVPIIQEFLNQAGIRAKIETLPYGASEFQSKYYLPQGDYEGFVVNPRQAAGIFDPVEVAFIEFTPSSAPAYTGFFSENSSYLKGDPEYTSLLQKARQEFDEKKRIALIHDFQRLEAANQYRPVFPGSADSLGINWPALQNYNLYHGDLPWVGLWLDQTLPPLKSV
jgi:peptide/nickel transport system substrate-binding protein